MTTVPEATQSAMPTGDLASEITAFAQEQGITIPATVAGTEPIVENTEPLPQPVVEQAEVTTPEIPDKFKTPDGQVDMTKVEKSTVNAESAINYYREIERELRKLQNQVNGMARETVAQFQQPAPANVAPYDLGQVTVQNIVEDLVNNGMSVDDAKKQAITLHKLAIIAHDTAYRNSSQAFEQRVSSLQERLDATSRREELEQIGQSDPWVFSDEGMKTLFNIRQQNPYLNHSDRPWSAAYDKWLADQSKQQRAGGQVKSSTPKASTAPSTPVGAAPRPVATPQIDFSNRASYESRLAQMPLEKQIAFLEKQLNERGMKFRK